MSTHDKSPKHELHILVRDGGIGRGQRPPQSQTAPGRASAIVRTGPTSRQPESLLVVDSASPPANTATG